MKLAAGANYVIIAYAQDETPIALTLRDVSGAAVAFTKPFASDSVWYPSLTYTPKTGGDYQAIVTGARAGTQYILRLYRWAPQS